MSSERGPAEDRRAGERARARQSAEGLRSSAASAPRQLVRAAVVRQRLAEARARIDRAAEQAGRDPNAVQILFASKYVAAADMGALAEAGVRLVGENRAQDLLAKASLYGDTFTWDFIGTLQSRKVKAILPHVRIVHSLASISALSALERHHGLGKPGLEVFVEVDLAGEEGKQGVSPDQIPTYLQRSPVPVTGLTAMPPATDDPSQSKRWFAALRQLAEEHGLSKLSMGTSQDYLIAVEEGATIVRLGRSLLGQAPGGSLGELSGEPSGELPGKPSGELPGKPSGELPGKPSGELPGKPSGKPSEGTSGKPSEGTSGKPLGGTSEDVSGEWSREPSGRSRGLSH